MWIRQPTTVGDVDQMFLDNANAALRAVGQSALEFLANNPGLSKVQLAQRLNRGANALGLVNAIYLEAIKYGTVRRVARELLVRQIRSEFPDGWKSQGDVCPSVKVGSWDYHIMKYTGNPKLAEYSENIIRDLAIENQPPEGWLPQTDGDPLVDSLFDRHWPNI